MTLLQLSLAQVMCWMGAIPLDQFMYIATLYLERNEMYDVLKHYY